MFLRVNLLLTSMDIYPLQPSGSVKSFFQFGYFLFEVPLSGSAFSEGIVQLMDSFMQSTARFIWQHATNLYEINSNLRSWLVSNLLIFFFYFTIFQQVMDK